VTVKLKLQLTLRSVSTISMPSMCIKTWQVPHCFILRLVSVSKTNRLAYLEIIRRCPLKMSQASSRKKPLWVFHIGHLTLVVGLPLVGSFSNLIHSVVLLSLSLRYLSYFPSRLLGLQKTNILAYLYGASVTLKSFTSFLCYKADFFVTDTVTK
jgi:hypothetical protein